MADIVIPLGLNGKLYYGVPGGAATIEVTGAVDVSVILEKDDAEVTRRASLGWEDVREATKRLRVTFNIAGTISAGVELTAFEVLRKTYLSGVYDGAGVASGIALHPVAAIAAAAAGAGGWGPLADFIITRFERIETLGEGQTYNVEARMTQVAGRYPIWTISPA